MLSTIFFILIYATLARTFLIGVKEVHIEKLVQCPTSDTVVVLDDVLLNYQKTVMNVNARFTLKQPVGGKIEMILELTKCQMKGEDTCEFNSRHRVTFDCKQLHAKNQMWSQFVQHTQDLPDKCPISAGSYNVSDVPFSLSNMERLPLHVGYWKISANGFRKRKHIFCVVSELDIQMQRRRRIKT